MTADQHTTQAAQPRRRPGATETSKRRIFAAALDLMGRNGVSATTVDDIAEAAGLAKGTVYYNFGSKTKMVGELLSYGFEVLFEELRSARQAVAQPGRRRLEAMIEAACDFLATYPNYLHLWISQAWRQDSPWLQETTQMRSRLMYLVTEELAQLPHRRTDIDVNMVATAAIGTLFLLGQERVVFGLERSKTELVQTTLVVVDGYCQEVGGD